MRQTIKTVVIVAPHFPPSNLAGVHRARLLSQHLEEYGWRPLIVTTHWRHYEEALDNDLAALVNPKLEIVYTNALPTRPVRIIGDIGIRAMPWHVGTLRRLRKEGRMDFLLITIPSFYSGVLGQLLYCDQPLPFGIDYIDPWVHVWPGSEIRFSKAWISKKLSEWLEPWAVKNASLITGVAEGYYQGVLERNPHLHSQVIAAAMPYGHTTFDFASEHVWQRLPKEFNPSDGFRHLVYAGALLPKAEAVLERFLEGLAQAVRDYPDGAGRLRIHFIGTGKSPNDPKGYRVLPRAATYNLGNIVTEHPHRMAYLDTLAHLTRAFGILVLGSTEAHYTPSKVYQAVQSRRPVLAFLHEKSTAVQVLRDSRAGIAITQTEDALPTIGDTARALQQFVSSFDYDADAVDWNAFESFSARESARRMAEAMDAAMERYKTRFKK